MKGIAATMLRLLYVSRMQRWLAACGFAVMLVALGALTLGRQQAAHSLIRLAGVLGIMIVVIAPVVAGPMLFGAMAAPRTMALIAHGRLKLVLGACCAQLLLALFLAAGLGAMASAPPATVFAVGFGALTVLFIGLSTAFYYRLAFLFWLPFVVLPRLLAAVFPHLHLGTRIMTPRGLAVLTAASALTWLVYGISVVKSRRTRLPLGNIVGLGSLAAKSERPDASAPHAPITYTAGDAMRMLLTGGANVRRNIILVVVSFGAVFILLTLFTADAPQRGGNPAFIFAFVICFMAALIPGIYSGTMARRARLLWLTSGMGRAELFGAIETQCWRLIFFAIGTALLMAGLLVALSNHSAPALNTLVAMAALPLACGSALVYVGLLYIRGNRFVDILIIGANTLFLAVVQISAAADLRIFPALVGIQIILVPLLRRVARRRWNHVDWLLLRQPLAAARMP